MRGQWFTIFSHSHFLLAQFGFDFGDLTAILDGYIQAFLSFLLQIIVYLWNVLVYVANYIWAALNFIANFFYNLAQDIARAFKWIWNSVIKVALTKLVNVFVRVQQWLHDTFKPLLDFLKKIRAWYDHFFNLYVKPILNAIGILRKFLQIFRLLGFKWASKLDALLGKIQTDILKAYELVRQQLNQVISWIQLVVDPTFLLRRLPLIGGLIRSAQELRNLELQTIVHPTTQGEADTMNRNRTWFLPASSAANQTYYAKGQLPPDVEAARQEFLNANLNPGDISAS